MKTSMILIKLYRQWHEIMRFKLKAIKENNSIGLYCASSDAEIYNKIIEIEKTLK
jgi:hypothetical protein